MKKLREIWNEWKLDKPTALGIGQWDDWHAEARANHPTRYFLQETIPDKADDVWRFFARPSRDAYWWIAHRVNPKHRYHVCKPRTLKPNYHDPRTMILHSSMECLVQFYEHAIDQIVWDDGEERLHAYNEIIAIYKWWTEEYPHRRDNFVNGDPLPEYVELPEEWGMMAMFNDKYRNEPIVEEWRKGADIRNKNDEDWYNKTEEMLIRLMKIRLYLWI